MNSENNEKLEGKYNFINQHAAALTACLLLISMGAHMGWAGPILPKILSEDYPFNITNEEGSYITLVGSLVEPLGSFGATLTMDKIGRKPTLMLIAIPQLLSQLMYFFSSYSSFFLYFGRIFGGVGQGAVLAMVPIYICEISDPKIRGRLGSYFGLIITLSLTAFTIIGSYTSIYDTALIFLCVPIIFLILFYFFMSETPYYWAMKNNYENCKHSLKFLYKSDQMEHQNSKITADVQRQMSESTAFKSLFTLKHNRRALVLSIAVYFFERFGGISAFTSYNQIFFQGSVKFISKEVGSILFNLVGFLSAIVAMFIIDKYGRKPLLIISTVNCFIILTILSIYFALKDFANIPVSNDWLPLVCIILYNIVFGIGIGPISNFFMGEIFSTSIKAKAACITNIFNCTFSMISIKIFQYAGDNYSYFVPFIVFAASQLIGSIYCCFCVPETKNKSLEEIQQDLMCD